MPQGEDQGIGLGALPGCGPMVLAEPVSERSLKRRLFERVRASGMIPRVDLARDLAISPATVTAIVPDLIDAGLLAEFEGGRGSDSTRGRPPVALGVRAEAGHVAGIKLSDQTHSAVILDFAGRRIGAAAIPSHAAVQDVGHIISAAQTVLEAATAGTGVRLRDLRAVGVGLPGMVDAAKGLVLWSPILSGADHALGAALSARLHCPVLVDNDANMVTLAELWFGAGRALADFAVVTIEHGVGMGLVLNHQLYRGAQGLGMEIGHTKVQLDGALCRCGKRGCLEAYVADYALVREASTALNWGHGGGSTHVLLESLYDHAKAGNAPARAIFDRAGRYLAVGLANVINLFDPSLIMLSGGRMRYDFLYAREMLAEMEQQTLSIGRRPPRVEINAWGDMVWAQGAAALALDHASVLALGG